MTWRGSSRVPGRSSSGSSDVYQPGVDVTYTLLNKKRLFAGCGGIGMDAPRILADEGEVEKLARKLSHPVLIKPRTQSFSRAS